jgi:hypothetical protein
MSLVSLVQDPVTGVALSRVERERLGGMRLGIKGKATGTTCVSVNSQHHDPWEEGRPAFCAAAAAKSKFRLHAPIHLHQFWGSEMFREIPI